MKTPLPCITVLLAILFLSACKPQNAATKITTADNSMNSLDWQGTYTGIMPCADCEGISTAITLKKDLTFVLRTKYLGKSDSVYESTGTFAWNKEGNKITLSGSEPTVYFVGENTLSQMDKSGNQIVGATTGKYILQKSMAVITEKYWKLTELMGKPIIMNETMAKEPHIIFHTADNRVNGNSSCNSFMGSYELKEGNRITLSKLAGTMMACPDMSIESEFLKILEMADNYYVTEDTLILNKAKMAPLARFTAVYLK